MQPNQQNVAQPRPLPPQQPQVVQRVAQAAQDVQTALPAIETVVSDLGTIKTGFKTSEWWITLATNVGLLGGGLLPNNPVWVQVFAAVTAGLTSIIYIISRVHIKK